MFRRLSKLWSGETNGLTAAAFIVGAASLASRFVGVLRDRALASTFGAGNALDAYFAAFRVPDFLYNLIIMGALSTGFIPVFSEYLETRDKKDAWKLAGGMVSIVGTTMAVVCAVGALTAPILIPLTVPGFTGEKLALTVHLSQIMFLSPFFLGLSSVMGGILQSTRRFVVFSLAPVFYNLCIIAGVYILGPRFGVMGVAWGVVLGAFVHFLVQASVVVRLGLRQIPFPSFAEKGIRRIVRLMLPRTAGLAVSQLNLVILQIFASSLPIGSIAIMKLADNLQSFPVGIVGVSFSVAAFPLLTKYASTNDHRGYVSSLESAARKIVFFIVPATALFLLLRAQIVRLVLGAGVFDWDDTIRTATVLGIFSVALLGQALIPLFARSFYAKQNTRTPLWIGVIAEVVNATGAYFLRGPLGINGLALSFSVATYVNCVLLFWFLEKKYGPFEKKPFWISGFKTVAASAALLLVGYGVRQMVGSVLPLRTFWQLAIQASAAAGSGAIAFLLVAWKLRSPEFRELHVAVNRKLFRRGPPVSGAEEAQGL